MLRRPRVSNCILIEEEIISEWLKEIKDLKIYLEDLGKETKEKDKKIELLKNELIFAEEQLDVLNKERLKDSVNNVKEIFEMKDRIKFLESQNEVLIEENEHLLKNNKNLKEDLAETDHHLDETLDTLSLMQYENDNLVEENLDLKNTEKVLRYQIDDMCKQVENFRKKMDLDITHNDEEAEGTYYPRTFQEGMREITDLYEGLRKDIAGLVEYCEWRDEEFSRINDENYELRLKKYEFGKLVRKVKKLLNESEDWPDLLKELIGESDD
jgi:chromosome segregation ATPase